MCGIAGAAGTFDTNGEVKKMLMLSSTGDLIPVEFIRPKA